MKKIGGLSENVVSFFLIQHFFGQKIQHFFIDIIYTEHLFIRALDTIVVLVIHLEIHKSSKIIPT